MDKEQLKTFLLEGKSTRQIEKIIGISHETIRYYVKKYDLTGLQKYKKPTYVEDFFSKITTKEQAYIIGFFCGDGDYNHNGTFSISLAKADACVIEYFSKNFGGNVRYSDRYDAEKRIFPSVNMSIGNKSIITDFNKYGILDYKVNRKIPIINKSLYRYLLLGFFDADGCLAFGRRKDRNRLWHKVTFTSSLSLLLGVQKILDFYKISTAIRPKGAEKCYEIVFCDVERVAMFLDVIYPDDTFVVLNRKYQKVVALRRKLGEFREASARSGGGNPEPSTVS